MGWLGRQLNQQRGISWVVRGMPETLTAWPSPRITLEHRSAPILLNIGSTFTLLSGCVCTFTPTSELRPSRYACRCAHFCLGANKGWDLMCSLWQRYSLPKVHKQVSSLCPASTCATTLVFPQNTDDCMSFLVRTVCNYNLLDCEVTGEIRLASSTHLLAGHLASHLKKEKQNRSLSNMAMISLAVCLRCSQNNIPKNSFLFVSIHLFYWYPSTTRPYYLCVGWLSPHA